LELAHGILECGARIVNLVDNENIFADEVRHFERGEVEPLGASYFFAGDLDLGVCVGARAEFFVERETDGLNGDVRIAVAFEEGAGWGWC